MTIQEILARTAARLAQQSPETARVEAEWILSALLDISRTELYVRSHEEFPPATAPCLEEIIARRLQGHPLQYLLGYTEFYGRRFACDPRALIPRPETEILAEIVLDYLNSLFPPQPGIHPLVWDIGTGCGNIAVTLAAERPDLWVLATDADRSALQLAGENALADHAEDRVTLACVSMFDAILAERCFAAICSNPPYVSERAAEMLPREVRDFEPPRALFAPEEGLFFVRQIVAQAAEYLVSGGLLALEIGFDQADAVRELLSTHGKYTAVKFTKDLAGHLRVAGAVRI